MPRSRGKGLVDAMVSFEHSQPSTTDMVLTLCFFWTLEQRLICVEEIIYIPCSGEKKTSAVANTDLETRRPEKQTLKIAKSFRY